MSEISPEQINPPPLGGDSTTSGELVGAETPPAPEPRAPAASTTPVSDPRDAEITDLRAQLEQLQAQARTLMSTPIPPAEPTPVPVDPRTAAPAPRPSVPPEPPAGVAFDENAQRDAEHAIRPGSAGLAVRELAQLLELAGVETYVSRGENPDNVFHDDLARALIGALDLRGPNDSPVRPDEFIVTAEVWLQLRDRAKVAA